MPNLSAVKAANAKVSLPFRPTALFVGGTSGIGQGAAQVFAKYTKGNARIILAGRNEKAAQQIISTFPKSSKSQYEFLYCDASKLKNVVAACNQLKTTYGVTKVNYLFMSAGYFAPKAPFYDNGEGIDELLALSIYSRFKYVFELLPLLKAAKDAGEEARVVTVLSAGQGGPVDLSKIGLRGVTGMPMFRQAITYTSLICEELARRNPGIAFIHNYPGFVNTPLSPGDSILFKTINWAVTPLKNSIAVSGEYQVYTLFTPERKSGAWHTTPKAEPVPRDKLYITQEAQSAIYQHLLDTFDAVDRR